MLNHAASRSMHRTHSLTCHINWVVASELDRSDPDRPALERARASGQLRGLRVLFVEDELLVAIVTEEDLQSAGCVVLGPYTTLASAMEAARTQEFDLAILDINLKGDMVYPLADELVKERLPFVFLTGYASVSVPERFRSAPRIAKPLNPAALIEAIRRILPH
jgi:CheY-like chemotaxis protein